MGLLAKCTSLKLPYVYIPVHLLGDLKLLSWLQSLCVHAALAKNIFTSTSSTDYIHTDKLKLTVKHITWKQQLDTEV